MSPAGSDSGLWEEYQSVLSLSRHMHPGDDVVDTVNRLLVKSPWLTESGDAFQISRNDLQISEESWELSRLWRLVHPKQLTPDEPASLNGAILLVRGDDVEYLIDGRRRVNSWHRKDVRGPHRTLVLQRNK